MKLKLVSEGIGDTLKVVNAETGECIQNVVSIEIRADADMFDGEPRVTLELTDVAVDVMSRIVREAPAGKYSFGVWP